MSIKEDRSIIRGHEMLNQVQHDTIEGDYHVTLNLFQGLINTYICLFGYGLRRGFDLTSPPYFSYLILSKEEALENKYVFLDMIEESIILFDRDSFFKNRIEEMKRRLEILGSRRIFLKDGTWYWDLKPDLSKGEVFEL